MVSEVVEALSFVIRILTMLKRKIKLICGVRESMEAQAYHCGQVLGAMAAKTHFWLEYRLASRYFIDINNIDKHY